MNSLQLCKPEVCIQAGYTLSSASHKTKSKMESSCTLIWSLGSSSNFIKALGRTQLTVVLGLRLPLTGWLSAGGCRQLPQTVHSLHSVGLSAGSHHRCLFPSRPARVLLPDLLFSTSQKNLHLKSSCHEVRHVYIISTLAKSTDLGL